MGEDQTVEGAAVRVSIVCFARTQDPGIRIRRLNGKPVNEIFSNLTSGSVDLTQAARLEENSGIAFQGSKKIGPFEISGDTARQFLIAPLNPNGRPNSDVLRISWIAIDIARRPRDVWIVDFGLSRSEEEAALYEGPFGYVQDTVRPMREKNNRPTRRRYWWRHGDGQPAMRAAISNLNRCIVTPEVAKHRVFQWANRGVLPDCKLMVIARDDDATFGILHSRVHELWSLAMAGWHGAGNDPRYSPTTTFETFPFPNGLTPNATSIDRKGNAHAQSIAAAAVDLHELRENWLNPPDLVDRLAEEVDGYPDRLVPVDDEAAKVLRKRTLTNLYNERPAWLEHAHKLLDDAVIAAYGWPTDLSEEEILRQLFELNQGRAAVANCSDLPAR